VITVPAKADEGEVLDLVRRKGPVSLEDIMDQQSLYSRDAVYYALKSLERSDKVSQVDGDLDTYGTTRDVWVTKDGS
jgi:hypothetical protein